MRPITPKEKPAASPGKLLANIAHERISFARNNVVFSQGDLADSVFHLDKGKVKLTVVSSGGKEAVIAVLGPSDFFGEGCLAGQPLRMGRATALSDCSMLRLEKASVIEALHREPALAELLLSYLLSRTIRIEEDLIDQLFNSSEKTSRADLLLLANFGKEGTA